MAKRKPAKPVPMNRAGRALRATRRPIVDKAAAFAMPGPAERDARQAALHSALAKFVARRENQSAAGKPVTEQNQTLAAEVDHSAHGAADLVHPGSATGAEIEGNLTTGSPEAPQSPASPPDETLPGQGEDCRPESTSAQETPIQREVEAPVRRRGSSRAKDTKIGAAIGAAMDAPLVRKRKRPTFRKLAAKVTTKPAQIMPEIMPEPPAPEIGDFRIDQLGMDQCRFACTADDAPRGQHRFCGAPTEIGPGNRWGSWCSKHLPRVFSDTSTLARPAFLKNAERSAR